MSERIGVIGLGLLGGAIADRLHEAGYTVRGYDPRPPKASHATVRPGAGEVFAECSRVILSLPNSGVATDVVSEVRHHLRKGMVVIDTTTGDPNGMAAIAEALARHGAQYIEASVAGSSALLRNREAPLFLAGDKDTIDGLAPLFAELAAKRFFLGPAGNASKFKLVHNLILGLNRAVLAEGLQFAEALGFNAEHALALLQQTPAVSGVMSTKGQRMANRSYDPPQALLSQHLKDVRLIIAEAGKTGARVPLSELHRELLEVVEQRGLGDVDNSAIMEAFNTE